MDRRRPDVSPSLNPERYLTHTTRAGVGGSDFYLALLYFTSHTLGESVITSGSSSRLVVVVVVVLSTSAPTKG